MLRPELAPPPYGAEVDLRGEKSFRIPAELFKWRHLAMMNTCETGAMFRLIAKSMQEVPAGSLVDDEDNLIDTAGFRDRLAEWPSVRARILFGWQSCSDGRIYNLDLVPTLKGMARQKSALDTGVKTRFAKGHPGRSPAASTGVQPLLSEPHGEPQADPIGEGVGVPEGSVEPESGVNRGSTPVDGTPRGSPCRPHGRHGLRARTRGR